MRPRQAELAVYSGASTSGGLPLGFRDTQCIRRIEAQR